MSIFSKALSQVGTGDLQELLEERAVENIRLEFKLQVPSKDETLKKLSSFANTFGGFMVVGAGANSSDGRVEELPGVQEEAGYKQKVVDWCFKHVSPPVTVEVSDAIPTPNRIDRFCYVIHVPESDLAPHFLNGRKGIWVRTDEFSARFESHLAQESELGLLFDRRKVIRERRANLLRRAKKRVDVYAPLARENMGIKAAFDSRLELSVVPRFPARPLCAEGDLKGLLRQNHIGWRGITFPVAGSDTISQHESVVTLGAAGRDSTFEANLWGLMFYCTKIGDVEHGVNVYAIHLYRFLGTTLLFARHAAQMLQGLGYAGPIHIQMSLIGMRDVPWVHGAADGSPGIYKKAGSVLDNEMDFSIPTTTELFYENSDALVLELLRYTFFSVNWEDLIDSEYKLQNLLGMGYRYNDWAGPRIKKG